MIFSVIQIVRALSGEQPLFRTLRPVELRRNDDGTLRYRVGNSAVVVSAKIDGRWHSLKCYTCPSERRGAIYGDRLLTDELMIPSESEVQWVDVSVNEWIEGCSLNQAIQRLCADDDRGALRELSQSFDRFALELLAEPWAHGDITCDNIILAPDGSLHLIDFDGSFLPKFSGLESTELGTEAFQHPSRTTSHFDRTLDDYPLTLISTALSTLALEPSLALESTSREGLLYTPSQCVAGSSTTLRSSLEILSRNGEPFAYAIATMLGSPTLALPNLYTILRYKVKGVHPMAKPTSIFCRDGLWGYLNEFNREVIPPIFTSAMNFSQGKATIKIGSHNHYINTQAQVVINGSQYQALKSFRNGSASALTMSGEWIEVTL